jgi:formiminotetrahydrofolate cyclodeaminase
MESLHKFNQAMNEAMRIANEIDQQSQHEMWEKAPVIIHQRFCQELVEVAKANVDINLSNIEDFNDIRTAIDILEKLYPQLKRDG